MYICIYLLCVYILYSTVLPVFNGQFCIQINISSGESGGLAQPIVTMGTGGGATIE